MSQQPEMRIADTDREAAVSALGEHFAAGRLSREEYDERSDQAWAAKTNTDLTPLFADLPSPRTGQPEGARRSPTGPPGPRGSHDHPRRPGLPGFPVVLVVLAVLAAVFVLRAPWLLFVAFGLLWCSGVLPRMWQGGWRR